MHPLHELGEEKSLTVGYFWMVGLQMIFSFWLSGFSDFSVSKMYYFCDGGIIVFLGKDGKLNLPIKFFFLSWDPIKL